MTAGVDSSCDCDCRCSRTNRGVSARRAMFAGALGGIVAVALAAARVAWLFRCCGRTMMERMVRGCECSPERRACMEKCGCGPRAEDRPEA